MFQEMMNGSRAVLTNPSVQTFEEHERDNLQWALIYSICAGVINAIITAIGNVIFPSEPLPPELRELGVADPGAANVFMTIFFMMIFTVIFLLMYWGIAYGLGKAFGGTGAFGELAYNMALFSAPLSVISNLVGLIPLLGWLMVLLLLGYNLYLTYLAIQAGMNLPGNKALYVIMILFVIVFVLAVCFGFFLAAALIGL
ncbi:YIP1 family protein [Candidatus Viridilinea mediisalina]|uniref:Yip1 domain-containing protein n=1 Tax=Candidatus Viridilinea mediisalina TaxID=2024553 RepID=A0A2A6RKI2_9CHLR|nr:YIP1 family protein [Candidatus Viridilinea mediisalina]PDW03587.1 hypothetical protein CJ255_07925 [Candidatus Viridilinea mediisalina]